MPAAVIRWRRRRSPWHPQGSTRRASPGSGTQPDPLQRGHVAGAVAEVTSSSLAPREKRNFEFRRWGLSSFFVRNFELRTSSAIPLYFHPSTPMSSALIEYLSARPDAATFLLPVALPRTLEELFPRGEALLPQPYKIF